MLLRAPMVREAEHAERMHIAGSDDARARERLRELLTVLKWAKQHACGIAWA